MDFEYYQEKAKETAVYPADRGLEYVTLGLTGEAGEVANQVKKILRDDHMVVTDDRVVKIADELGDILWYVASLCTELGINMNNVAFKNLAKLKLRNIRNSIKGDKRDAIQGEEEG